MVALLAVLFVPRAVADPSFFAQILIYGLANGAIYALIAGCLAVGYTLPGIQFLGSARELGILGGYFLLAASFFAFYAATALIVNSSWKREVVPLFSLRR